MIVSWLDLVLAILGTNQVIETLHHGSIFADWRGRNESRGDFYGDLVSCPFCLSHWIAILLMVAYFSPQFFAHTPEMMDQYGSDPRLILFAQMFLSLTFLGKFIIQCFAISRGAQILNDVLKSKFRVRTG